MDDVKTIVLDLGNVVFDISFDRMYGYWAEQNGIDADKLRKRLVFDETYCQFERGELTPDEYRNYAIGKLGFEMDYAEFDRGWNRIYLDVLPGIATLVKALHSKYQLAVLTNTNTIHAERWREQYAAVLQYFNHVFCSFELGARKPERAIYARMLEGLQVAPERVLFFDDKGENVAGAKRCGIRAFQIGSCEDIVSRLGESGIKVSKIEEPRA